MTETTDQQTFVPTPYQRMMWGLATAMLAIFSPETTFPPIDGMADNGDGENNIIIHIHGMTLTIPPEPFQFSNPTDQEE